MKYKDGTELKAGDLIAWHVDDRDDNIVWQLIGLVKHDHVVYLGGGVDFGRAIGKRLEFDEVLAQSEDNESYQEGINKIGDAHDAVKAIHSLIK